MASDSPQPIQTYMLAKLKRALPSILRDERLEDLEYTVVDVETTCLELPPKACIFEIAAVRVGFNSRPRHVSSFVRPSSNINPEVERLTGISSIQIQAAPQPEETYPRIFSFINSSIFASYPLFFDHRHVNYAFKQALGKSLSVKKLCIRSLFEFLYPDPQPRTLDYALITQSINMPVSHRALDDALAEAQLLLSLLRVAKNRGFSHFYELNREVSAYMHKRGLGPYATS